VLSCEEEKRKKPGERRDKEGGDKGDKGVGYARVTMFRTLTVDIVTSRRTAFATFPY
jgi:hypothetical protein